MLCQIKHLSSGFRTVYSHGIIMSYNVGAERTFRIYLIHSSILQMDMLGPRQEM